MTAEAEGVKGTARIRIIPPLPWAFDLSDKEVPITWIGARYRHVFREVEGEPMIVKISTIPLGTRSQAWMGPTDLHDYTIQADVRAPEQRRRMGNVGITAQRYTLMLEGTQQRMKIEPRSERMTRAWAHVLQRPAGTGWSADRPDLQALRSHLEVRPPSHLSSSRVHLGGVISEPP